VTQSPPKPWVKGEQPTYTAFQLTVNICKDGDGNVWSDHNFATPKDAEIAETLRADGPPMLAHSLLIEAVRREAFMCVLVEMSKDPDPKYLAQWMAVDDGNKHMLEAELQRAVKTTITRTLEKMVPGAVSEVLAMMADQV
jgi:hypothetical protein